MLGTVLAIAPPHGAAASAGTETHWLAIGLLVGIVAALVAPIWLTGLIIVFDLVALGWTYGILNYVHGGGRWLVVAIPCVLIGLYFGVTRGLKHLGESEFRARQANIRKNGRFL
jgi:hypothetical protein